MIYYENIFRRNTKSQYLLFNFLFLFFFYFFRIANAPRQRDVLYRIYL